MACNWFTTNTLVWDWPWVGLQVVYKTFLKSVFLKLVRDALKSVIDAQTFLKSVRDAQTLLKSVRDAQTLLKSVRDALKSVRLC